MVCMVLQVGLKHCRNNQKPVKVVPAHWRLPVIPLVRPQMKAGPVPLIRQCGKILETNPNHLSAVIERLSRWCASRQASQFNCLEFVGPSVVPEDGVTGYADDRTQGPACSVACGPATVYRNYYAPVGGPGAHAQQGQTAGRQLNNLEGVAEMLAEGGDESEEYFWVQGGYIKAKNSGRCKAAEAG